MIHILLAVIYLAFISLGLPDSLLGSAWPSMYPEFGVSVSMAGAVSMIVSVGTIVSSLMSDRITKRLGTGLVTALSVSMTAVALFGFSVSGSVWQLMLWAVPYGLGAGSVDAALNNYVAIHYASRHMSWLHCMWGVGALTGPYIMGWTLTTSGGWQGGYRIIFLVQMILALIIFISLPLWKKKAGMNKDSAAIAEEEKKKPLSLIEIVKIDGVVHILLMFFCYCALEATAMLWASSYMVLHSGIDAKTAAFFASLFFIGLTLGRAVNGFLTFRFTDTQMIRTGSVLIAIGGVLMLLPFGKVMTITGLIVMGIGCAPIYPCIIHTTPVLFGAERSQAIIGVQMASAYVGSCLMPPLFGLIVNHISASLFPVYILAFLVLMVVMHEVLIVKTKKK